MSTLRLPTPDLVPHARCVGREASPCPRILMPGWTAQMRDLLTPRLRPEPSAVASMDANGTCQTQSCRPSVANVSTWMHLPLTVVYIFGNIYVSTYDGAPAS